MLRDLLTVKVSRTVDLGYRTGSAPVHRDTGSVELCQQNCAPEGHMRYPVSRDAQRRQAQPAVDEDLCPAPREVT